MFLAGDVVHRPWRKRRAAALARSVAVALPVQTAACTGTKM